MLCKQYSGVLKILRCIQSVQIPTNDVILNNDVGFKNVPADKQPHVVAMIIDISGYEETSSADFFFNDFCYFSKPFKPDKSLLNE